MTPVDDHVTAMVLNTIQLNNRMPTDGGVQRGAEEDISYSSLLRSFTYVVPGDGYSTVCTSTSLYPFNR